MGGVGTADLPTHEDLPTGAELHRVPGAPHHNHHRVAQPSELVEPERRVRLWEVALTQQLTATPIISVQVRRLFLTTSLRWSLEFDNYK